MADRRRSGLGLVARVVNGVRWRLERLGLHITPFVTIREGAEIVPVPETDGAFDFRQMDQSDIDELVRLEPEEYNREKLERWFGEGKICFGLLDGPHVVAKTWCDFSEINFPPAYRKLDPGEAYLFAAYADPAFRGRNLAPAVRALCYARLREMGFSRFYSHSIYFNRPARRFKAKLGGIEEDLRIQLRLADKWSKTWIVKRYGR